MRENAIRGSTRIRKRGDILQRSIGDEPRESKACPAEVVVEVVVCTCRDKKLVVNIVK